MYELHEGSSGLLRLAIFLAGLQVTRSFRSKRSYTGTLEPFRIVSAVLFVELQAGGGCWRPHGHCACACS